MPSVSVIMPCFNHARFLADSVQGILQQTYRDLELIIVDDCSSDDSWATINRLAASDARVQGIRHEKNGGASKSRNDGMKAAKGDFIGFCDADDIWKPEKLKTQVNLLQSNRQYDVTYSDAIIIDELGQSRGQRFSELFAPPGDGSGNLFPHLIRRNFINMQSVLMRRNCLQRAEGFDEGIKWVEDWWYWVRVSRHHQFVYSKESLAMYRVHSKSTSVVQKRGYRVNRCKVFRRILREYPDLPSHNQADILYQIGVELGGLGKKHMATRLYRSAARLSLFDIRASSSLWKALGRMAAQVGTPG